MLRDRRPDTFEVDGDSTRRGRATNFSRRIKPCCGGSDHARGAACAIPDPATPRKSRAGGTRGQYRDGGSEEFLSGAAGRLQSTNDSDASVLKRTGNIDDESFRKLPTLFFLK